MLLILLVLKLDKSIESKEEQLLNILLISSLLIILKLDNSKKVKEKHSLNI